MMRCLVTNYPWISAATKLPDGSILVGMAEEREDEPQMSSLCIG